MPRITNFSDLERVAHESQKRHASMRDARMNEIVKSIQSAMDTGAEDLPMIFERLSPRERDHLVAFFPQFMKQMHKASSPSEMRAVVAGARALLRSVAPEANARGRDPQLARLARAALVTAHVQPEKRRVLSNHLRVIDEAKGPKRLTAVWFFFRARAFVKTLARAFTLKS